MLIDFETTLHVIMFAVAFVAMYFSFTSD